jgi:hypothetical protein
MTQGGLVGVPTLKRPQVDDVQYPRVSNKILKGASHEEVVNDESDKAMLIFERMECRDTKISCIAARSRAESPEACRPWEGLMTKEPKHPEALGRAIRPAPHREAFIPDVKSWVGLLN